MAKDRKYLSLDGEDLTRKRVCEEYHRHELSQQDAAIKLDMSTRQFRRIFTAYTQQGETGLMHGLRGKNSNHKGNQDKEQEIKDFISQPKYKDFRPTFLMEELTKIGIEVSDEWMRKYMMKIGRWESKKQRDMTIRHRRERKPYIGEMIQYDGSYHRWFEDRIDDEFCLLVAIDDATGNIMHLIMGDNEGYKATIRFWVGYMMKYGVPEIIYVDRFATYKVNHKKAVYDKTMITNFEKAMKKLGCLVIKANSPQAKGRVERSNQTLQDRLVKKMRLDEINTVVAANNYMENIYMPRHNTKYGEIARETGDKHKPLSEEKKKDLLRICAIDVTRVIQNDYIVTYCTRCLQLEPKNITRVYTKTKCIVRENINGEIQIIVNEKVIPYTEIDPYKVQIKKAEHRRKINAKKELEKEERAKIRQEERHRLSKERKEKGRKEREKTK